MKTLKALFIMSAVILLTACGSDNKEDIVTCVATDESINWNLLQEGSADKLSEYNLFPINSDPSKIDSERGLPYDLSAPLFTDYATKYRFAFVPECKTAIYNEQEALNFPVGSVLVKTFTMPSNTEVRGIEHEKLLETRLLIKQSNTWIARTYVWNDEGTEAFLKKAGVNIKIDKLIHHNEELSFTYAVPDQNQCLTCHQFTPKGKNTEFRPLGPKARYLNSDYDYGAGLENQLLRWKESGLLTGLPTDLSKVQKAAVFNDDLLSSDYSGTTEMLTDTAKTWLDINCGHCHRPGGQASNTAFRADYNVPWKGNELFHGACAAPVSGASAGSTKIIVPGNADSSLLYNRMHTTDAGLSMPPLGRATIHEEGSALIKAWINSLSFPICQ